MENEKRDGSHTGGGGSSARISYQRVATTSLIFGFLLIPVHELGHVICDWLTGHPAGMSYARDYLLDGGATPFFGVLGGPLLPILVSAAAVFCVYRGTGLWLWYPVAIQAALDRVVPFVMGMLPSDERDLAKLAGRGPYAFRNLFLCLECLLLGLIVLSFFRHKLGVKRSVLILVLSVAGLVVGAGAGILIVERLVFPEQYHLQFG